MTNENREKREIRDIVLLYFLEKGYFDDNLNIVLHLRSIGVKLKTAVERNETFWLVLFVFIV